MALRCGTWVLPAGEWESSPTLSTLAEQAGLDPCSGEYVILGPEDASDTPLGAASLEDVQAALHCRLPPIVVPADNLEDQVLAVIRRAELSHYLLVCRNPALHRPAAYYAAEQAVVVLDRVILKSSLAQRLGLRDLPQCVALRASLQLNLARRLEEGLLTLGELRMEDGVDYKLWSTVFDFWWPARPETVIERLDWSLWERALDAATFCAQRICEAHKILGPQLDASLVDWSDLARNGEEERVISLGRHLAVGGPAVGK